MASYIDLCRRNMDGDDLPRLAYSFKCLQKELIELVKNDYPEIQQCMDRLCDILKTYEENSKLAATGSKHGKTSGIAGGVMMGVGILFCSGYSGGFCRSWRSRSISGHRRCSWRCSLEIKEIKHGGNI